MKELTQHLKVGDKTEVVAKKKQKVEYVLEGAIKPKNGHRIFEVDVTTKEVKEAEYERVDTAVMLNGNKVEQKQEKLITRKDCIYIPALNKRTALDKFNKDNRQSSYYVKEAPFKLDEHFIN